MQGSIKQQYWVNLSCKCKTIFRTLVVVSFILATFTDSHASHIVGGQLTYRYLGNNRYEIKLVVRRDCIHGSDTVPFDNPAIIGVFYNDEDKEKAYGVGTDGTFRFKRMNDDTLFERIDTVCPSGYTPVCVHQSTYIDTVFIPFDERGYLIVYQRCCRNKTLDNIVQPDHTGMTLTANITPVPNHSPQFGDFPPIYTCLGAPFTFDHAATDPDGAGDSLVYSLCTPYQGKTFDDPAGRPDTPPYIELAWKTGNGLGNLNGSPLAIDPLTGLIQLTPNMRGQYLIGICVSDYRGGKLLSTVRRELELNVVACGQMPTASFTISSDLCEGLKVEFQNGSMGASEYFWYFDWINDRSLKSQMSDPTFTYSKPGTYQVALIAKDLTCTDTAFLEVTVIDPQLHANFKLEASCDSTATLKLEDVSTSRYSILDRMWTISGPHGTIQFTGRDTLLLITDPGKYEVHLRIGDEFGCEDSMQSSIELPLIDIEFNGNEYDLCLGDSVRLVKSSKPGLSYNWQPTEGLVLSDPSNPLARPTKTTTYRVTVSEGPCSLEAAFLVVVRNQVNLMLTADSVSCDGKVNLSASSDSTKAFKWSLDPAFHNVLSTDSVYSTQINANTRFFVLAGDSTQCQDTASILVKYRNFKLKFQKEYSLCTGDSVKITLESAPPGDSFRVKWNDHIFIPGDKTQNEVWAYPTQAGIYWLVFTAWDENNCSISDSIKLAVLDHPVPEIFVSNDCGSLEVGYRTNAIGRILWDFGDGAGNSTNQSGKYLYPKTGKYTIRLKSDTICQQFAEQEVTVVDLSIELPDSLFLCPGDTTAINPGGNPRLRYIWSPPEGLSDVHAHNPLCYTDSSGWYYVTVRDPDYPDSCSRIDSIYVLVAPTLFANAGRDTILCAKGSLQLTGNAEPPDVKYSWCNLEGKLLADGPVLNTEVDTSGDYILKVYDAYGCSSADTMHIELYHLNGRIIGPDVVCLGDTVKLAVHLDPDGKYTYEWQSGTIILGDPHDSTILAVISEETRFSVTILNAAGCSWTFHHTVGITDPSSELLVAVDPDLVVAGQETQLTATYRPGWRYDWGPKDGSLSNDTIYNPIARPLKTTRYTVTVTDENGCTATAGVQVTVQTCPEAVFLPNAFSPNGDSKNDELCIRTRAGTLARVELIIHSRWGEQVFATKDPAVCWDGTYKNKKLSPDVFGYLLKFSCLEQDQHVKVGNITLLK
ncbi:MAG: gliding motility-associated C-terminal domain-containing protein [Saprospiraceae bacterium]|nr:gliding motility-associated C-terminal domain-containing protein [Saprospiraceae bacterium]